MKAIIPILALILSATFQAHAEQFGLFTYFVNDGEVTIIGYPEDATGHMEIPAEIHGLPVSRIRNWFGKKAFSNCTSLTSIFIPASVTEMGINFDNNGSISFSKFSESPSTLFSDCTSLTRFDVDPQNPNFSSLDGVLYNKNRTTLLRYPAGKSGGFNIPNTVNSVSESAFSDSVGLTSLIIPESVTIIRDEAFSGCSSLTALFFPTSVISIGEPYLYGGSSDATFSGCTGLTQINVDLRNPSFSSLDGVLYNKNKTSLIQYPAGKTGSFETPDTVNQIRGRSIQDNGSFFVAGRGGFEESQELSSVTLPDGIYGVSMGTFKSCSALTSVTIPASVKVLGYDSWIEDNLWILDDVSHDLAGAFENCTSLHSAIFHGDAPTTFDPNTFANTAPNFTIYYLSTSTGFTSPTWNGYPTVMLDDDTYPAAPWLVSHGLPQDTDLDQDLNGDGVSLLMAYALNLDPNVNLSQHMPAPVLVDDSLTLTFHAAAPGVSYTVETSTDLKNWTSDGVAISDLASNKQRTASVPLDAPQRFLRLVVSQIP